MMYFLGVDPSTTSTGFAVLDEGCNLIEYGVIKPDRDDSDEGKLHYQYSELKDLVGRYNYLEYEDGECVQDREVRAILCEDQFNGPNVDTLKKIARTASMIMLLASQKNIKLHMIYPASWRKSFHGTGKAVKADTINLANEMFALSLKKKDNDIADAIGLAVACWKLYNEVKD